MREIPVDLGRLPILSGDGIHYARMQGLILAAGALQRPQAIASETGYLVTSILTALPDCSTLVIDCKHIPLRQNSCRPDMILNLGPIRTKDGTVRRSIQE